MYRFVPACTHSSVFTAMRIALASVMFTFRYYRKIFRNQFLLIPSLSVSLSLALFLSLSLSVSLSLFIYIYIYIVGSKSIWHIGFFVFLKKYTANFNEIYTQSLNRHYQYKNNQKMEK